jgi:hypothetical protein
MLERYHPGKAARLGDAFIRVLVLVRKGIPSAQQVTLAFAAYASHVPFAAGAANADAPRAMSWLYRPQL